MNAKHEESAMKFWKRNCHGTMATLVVVMFGLSACDEAVTAGVTEGLSLTSGQTAAVNELAASFGARIGEPGALWRLAAELHGTLTSEQIAQIVDRQAERLEQMAARTGDRPAFGRGQGRFGHGPRGGPARLLPDATDEQRQAIREVLESFQPQFEALHEQLRSGEITPQEFRTQARELRQAVHAEIEPLLSDEQRAALDEHRAQREAFMEEAKAVRIEVLGLTDAQIAELEALKEQRMSAPLGDASITERIAAHREAVATILSDTQMEIASLYHALRAGAFRGNGHGPRGPFGGFRGA
jgi:Spy/CpxP family protein refolding chaperone